MAIRIRLTRGGRKKRPFYRVVAADSHAPRDGRFLEIVGTYDPLKEPYDFKYDKEKVKKWMSRGAKPSETVYSLLKKAGFYKEQAA